MRPNFRQKDAFCRKFINGGAARVPSKTPPAAFGGGRKQMYDEQTDDTSMPFVPDEYFRNFLAGKGSQPSQQAFPNEFQQIGAEMNRRLMRQQAKLLAAQDLVARSLTRATWVLSFATIILASATIGPVLWHVLF
jgi:hypothetical protein